MTNVHYLEAVSLGCGHTKAPRKRRVTLARAMRQANKAEVAVSGATINVDGSITLTFGGPATGSTQEKNEWDTVQ